MSTVQARTSAPEQTSLLRDTGMKHELICVSVVSPILNLRLWPRPGRRKELHVFINRQKRKGEREKWAQQMTETIWESNSSCDNIARSSPLPPQPPTPPSPTLSHVTAVQERLQLEKVNRWLGPRTKWSWFSKSTCGIWGGNGFAAKHSITRNYNNSTLEDGLFHFIMRFALSCLMMKGGGGHREQWQGLCQTDTRALIIMLSCFHFFLSCLAGVELTAYYYFFQNLIGHRSHTLNATCMSWPLSTANIQATGAFPPVSSWTIVINPTPPVNGILKKTFNGTGFLLNILSLTPKLKYPWWHHQG